MNQSLPTIMPGATARFYRGNAIGCLVAHGFMASPAEVGWLAAHLAEQGYTVYAPRLPGHGIDPGHMPRMRWQDWYAHLQDSYQLLRQQCDQVVVIGHSMGGLLAGLLASEQPVDALVMAAAPLSVTNRLMPHARRLSRILPFRDFPSEPALTTAIIAAQTERGEPVIGRVNYQRWSIRAIHELYELILLVPARLSHISAPTLLLYAQGDTTVPLSDLSIAQQHLPADSLETHTLSQGAHIIFQDVGRDEAFAVVADFVARQVG